MRRLSYVPAAAALAVTLAVVTVTTSRTEVETFAPNPPVIVIDAASGEGHTEQAQFLRSLRDYRNAQIASESTIVKDRKPGFLSG